MSAPSSPPPGPPSSPLSATDAHHAQALDTRPPPPVEADDLLTVRDCLRAAVSRFERAGLHYGHGTADSIDEAAWLVCGALRLPPDRLELFLDARLSRAERELILHLIDRRVVVRQPLAYLLGEAWLRGRRFLSDQRALVPRSLIAEAIEEGLGDWYAQAPATVLDLCTGGGSIAIIAAQHWDEAQVVGSDWSVDALALARANVDLHRLGGRIELVQGDLFESLGKRRFDLILCNPPYVNETTMAGLPAEFRAEPRGALAGGQDGMDLIRRLISAAPDHLEEDGGLLLEIGHEAAHFEAAFPGLEFAWVPVTAGPDQLVWIEAQALQRS